MIRTDAEMFGRGEPLPVDEHFDRRLEALLDEAARSGDYRQVTPADFDAMERDAEELARQRKSR